MNKAEKDQSADQSCQNFWPPFWVLLTIFTKMLLPDASNLFKLNLFHHLIHSCMHTRILHKTLPNTAHNCTSICNLRSKIDILVKSDIYILHLLNLQKSDPTSSKLELIQKPQFLSTLFSNFWYFSISTYVSNGKWPNFGWSPLWKTFLILDHCVMERSSLDNLVQPQLK